MESRSVFNSYELKNVCKTKVNETRDSHSRLRNGKGATEIAMRNSENLKNANLVDIFSFNGNGNRTLTEMRHTIPTPFKITPFNRFHRREPRPKQAIEHEDQTKYPFVFLSDIVSFSGTKTDPK